MMKRRELVFYNKYQPQFALSSSAVLTVSKYSKKDIHEKYLLDLDDIFIVYNGSRFEKNPPDPAPDILSDLGLQEGKYFIYTGSVHPGKISFVWLRLLKNFLRNGWMDTSLYWQDVMPGRPRNFIRSSVNHRSNMILYRLDMCQTGTYGHC